MSEVTIRKYKSGDLPEMIAVWNEVVEGGVAFPQEEMLDSVGGEKFFAAQTYCGVAEVDGKVLGLYILHPNNVGRCGHICNASYAVSSKSRGQHIGEKLVLDCIRQAHEEGFRVLQFNAVVRTNIHARHLYERIGFKQLGTIPGGFRMKDGSYEDICPYYNRGLNKLSPPQCFMCRGGRVLYLSALQMKFAVKSIRPPQESCREVAEGLFRFAQSK